MIPRPDTGLGNGEGLQAPGSSRNLGIRDLGMYKFRV